MKDWASAIRLGDRCKPDTTGQAVPLETGNPPVSEVRRGDNAGKSTGGKLSSNADTGDPEIDHWLQGNDEPLEPEGHDLFQINPPPSRVIAILRPIHLCGNARTLALIGQRGGGKSSLLRLAQGLPDARSEIELRFIYVSLWEYENARAAIRSAINKVLLEIQDRIDAVPFTGAGDALVRAMAGDDRYGWLWDAFGMRVPVETIFRALSTILLFNKLRVIICVEDDDRLQDGMQKEQFIETVTGTLDFIKQFPGFGYVLCIKSDDWSKLENDSLTQIEPPEKQRKRLATIQPLVQQTWHPQSSGEIGATANGTAAKTEAGAQTATTPASHEGVAAPVSKTTSAESLLKAHIFTDIDVKRRAAAMAAEKLLGGFDTSRLCREDLIIPPLAHEQWQPLLDYVRNRMFDHVGQKAPEFDCFGLVARHADGQNTAGQPHAGGRQLVWTQFIDKLQSAPFTFGRPIPEFSLANSEGTGFSFTPRSLRLGLSMAWRKWLVIQPDPGKHPRIIDPDSVLVACLLRTCRPDVWNIIIRDVSILVGGNWPVTGYLVQNAIEQEHAKKISELGGKLMQSHQLDHDQIRFQHLFPHLGVSQEIINVMRKSCCVQDLSRPTVDRQNSTQPAEAETTKSNNVLHIEVVRPGGLIGSLPNESNPGSNWRLFLNA
jgi:energy-coupling factor transporter ATP-binding protein EcfA2